jgi:hypothetical protein
VDRISVRSFRSLDIAEHGLKELARSRLDTTRAVVFQPLGARFAEVRDDPRRAVDLLREDAFHAEDGHFARLSLRVNPSWGDRLATIDPRAVERRLEEATRQALLRELPGRQGVYFARFEPSNRGDLEPVVHVHASCRLSNGEPAPALTHQDAERFRERWNRHVERAFGLARGGISERDRAHGQDRLPSFGPEAARLRVEWVQASARVLAVRLMRLAGRATPNDLAEALAHARAARAAWTRLMSPDADRGATRRRVFDQLDVRIEGGTRYLGGTLEGERHRILETAAARAAGLADAGERRLAVVAWPVGRSLYASVYFNERRQAEQLPGSLDPERLRSQLEDRLRDELRAVATDRDPAATARAEELGAVEVRRRKQEFQLHRPAPSHEQAHQPIRRAEPAILVAFDRDLVARRGPAAPIKSDQQEAFERSQPEPRNWATDRAVVVRLSISTGGEQVRSAGLSRDETAHVLRRAINRAYPFLEQGGIRNNFVYAAHGRRLDVQVAIPEKLGWTAEQLRSPQFQQRFVSGFYQALGQVERNRIRPERTLIPSPGVARALAAIREAPQLIRAVEQDPERAARQVARAVFDKLSRALPKPFRVMRELGRNVERFIARGD